MASFDIKDVLNECKKSANVGYKIASAQYKVLNNTLLHASETIKSTMTDFSNSPCFVSGATEALSQQLIEINSSFNKLSFAFKEDLANLRENPSQFSITLFGRTMAGKSTLMEILTQGDGQSIGTGAQRTTRDVRKYSWNELEITDVPGIGAFEGEEDEQIAFEAAKMADLILFLITDDAPQASEAECFGRIVNLGKPIICIMNIKAAVSESKSIKLAKRDVDKRFDRERLDAIRAQFLSYAQQLGQEWGNVPFVYVHLKSAYMAQNCQDEETAALLRQMSRIDYLENKIIDQIRQKGQFYRIKTFIDIISNPMLGSMENLLSQSLINSAQGRTILSKRRQLAKWKEHFEHNSLSRIQSLMIKIMSDLNGEIAVFAEEHYDDKNADKAWDNLLKSQGIQLQCQQLLESIEEQCNDKIKEVSREISNELKFASSFARDKTLKMHSIIDSKKVWNWSTTIIGGGLTIASIIAQLFGAAIAGPLGWGALAVGVVGFVGSLLLKNRDKKAQEARQRLENSLKKNVTTMCKKLQTQMEKNLDSLINERAVALLKEMDRMNSVVFNLADTQKELAWNLDTHLMELNLQIVTEAIKLIGAEGLEYHIKEVARIPGVSAVLMLNDGSVFPKEEKNQLHMLMSESIGFIYDTDNKRNLISRVIGKSIERSDIHVEEKIGVAHVPLDDVPPYIMNRVRMAQQFARLAITK